MCYAIEALWFVNCEHSRCNMKLFVGLICANHSNLQKIHFG